MLKFRDGQEWFDSLCFLSVDDIMLERRSPLLFMGGVTEETKAMIQSAQFACNIAAEQLYSDLQKLGAVKLSTVCKSMQYFLDRFEEINFIEFNGSIPENVKDMNRIFEDIKKEASVLDTYFNGGYDAEALSAIGAYGMAEMGVYTSEEMLELQLIKSHHDCTQQFLSGRWQSSCVCGYPFRDFIQSVFGIPVDPFMGLETLNDKLEGMIRRTNKLQELCEKMSHYVLMYDKLLCDLNQSFVKIIDHVHENVSAVNTNDAGMQELILTIVGIAGGMKRLLDIPLLNWGGDVTDKSQEAYDAVLKFYQSLETKNLYL